MDMMPMASFMGRAVGFLLLFIGTLVAVAFSTPGGGCYDQSPDSGGGSSYIMGAANAILVAKILWAIGLFLVGAGAGLKLHWSLSAPSSGRPEDTQFIVSDRRLNGILLLVCIVLLWLLLMIPAGVAGPGAP
jgi:hypothetical protein